MTVETWLAFVAVELLLSLTPGPAVLLVASQGVRSGARASAHSAAGVIAANAVYFAISAIGLGAVVLASPLLYETIRWAGVLYLVYLAARLINSRGRSPDRGIARERSSDARAFTNGFVTQIANPKVLLYFTALLPQFVGPGHVSLEFVVLGVTSVCIELPVLLAYGHLAGRGGAVLRNSRMADRMAGAFLVATAARLATVRRG